MNRLNGDRGAHARSAADGRIQHRPRRFAKSFAVMFGLGPVIAVAWSVGCSDSDDAGGGNFVDPGGTFGAEISLTVVGRGRVTANLPGLDCPSSDCFRKYIFSSSTADGAAGGLTLKAQATPGSNFQGWSFATEPSGTAGRGPTNCNPITRAASAPSVSMSAAEISLPFGEVEGTPPAGQEAACATARKVPTVYKITATFDTPIVDAGPDAAAGEILYTPTATSTASDIGIAGGRLFWRENLTTSSYETVRYIDSPTGTAPQPAQPVSGAGDGVSEFSTFEADPNGVVYQLSGSSVGFISPTGTPTARTMPSSSGLTCYGLAVDTQQNVYCRTSSAIYRWSAPSYTAPETLFTGVTFGYDLHIDGATTIYYSTSSGIYSLLVANGTGGTAAPSLVTSASTSGLAGLEGNASYLWWLQAGYVYACPRTSCITPINTGLSASASTITAPRMAVDTSSLYLWAASSSTIYRSYYAGGSSTVPLKTGLAGIGGVAADSTYVYWTQADGSVRRAPKGM